MDDASSTALTPVAHDPFGMPDPSDLTSPADDTALKTYASSVPRPAAWDSYIREQQDLANAPANVFQGAVRNLPFADRAAAAIDTVVPSSWGGTDPGTSWAAKIRG